MAKYGHVQSRYTAYLLWVLLEVGLATPWKQRGSEPYPYSPHVSGTRCPSPDPLCHPNLPRMNQQAPEVFFVRFKTTRGNFDAQCLRKWSPNGVDRIFNLVTHHFYDNTALYRVIPGFVVQFGVSGDPTVNSIYDYNNEFPGAVIMNDPIIGEAGNLRGYISFSAAYNSNGTATSRTTELFINMVDNSAKLDSKGFTPCCVILDQGMEAVVDRIYSGYGRMADECEENKSVYDGDIACAGPSERRLYDEGNVYLKKNFPNMDYIVSASITKRAPTSIGPFAILIALIVLSCIFGVICVIAIVMTFKCADTHYKRDPKNTSTKNRRGFQHLSDSDEEDSEQVEYELETRRSSAGSGYYQPSSPMRTRKHSWDRTVETMANFGQDDFDVQVRGEFQQHFVDEDDEEDEDDGGGVGLT